MILGIALSANGLIFGGLVLGVLVALTVLVGLRVIRFKGRMHLKVHKGLAWAVVGFALLHAFLALTYLENWSILS